jgi:hypothetical protein
VAIGLLFWSGCGGVSSVDPHAIHDRAGHSHAQPGHAHHGETGHLHEPGDEHSDRDAAGHTHVGPHGGRLIVLGDEDYHAELVIDHDTGAVTVCVLDRTGRKPVAVAQRNITLNFKCQGRPQQIRLAVAESPTDQSDVPSCFTATSDLLRGECQLVGRLNVVIGGKPYSGRVAHREEDHRLIR